MSDDSTLLDPGPGRVSFPDIVITRAGTYQSQAGGEVVVTPEDLASMVEAEATGVMDAAAVKPGHFDPRFDGEPAMGWMQNLRLSADKQSLLADIADVPAPLVGLIRDGYRRRSIEFDRNVTGRDGKVYKAVATGLALLGMKRPAVSGLGGLSRVYASAHEPGETVDMDDGDTARVPHMAALSLDDGTNSPATGDITDKEGGPTVDLIESIKEALGLAPEATDEEVLAAVEAARKAAEDAVAASAKEGEPKPAAALSGFEAPAGTVLVSAEQWEAARKESAANSVALSALEAEATERRVSEALSSAEQSGRIAPAERAAWEKNLTENFTATSALLSSLEPRFATTPTPGGLAVETDDDALLAAARALGI